MKNKMHSTGTLYLVATPIGNVDDMSLRAIHILKTVDHIAAEDTRHSRFLLQHFGITTPLFSLHEHNEKERTKKIMVSLQQGETIALISDAGTPLISDPGFYIVREAKKRGISVVPIPGACAAITALSASGLPTDRFQFEGFLPVKTASRRKRLTELRQVSSTIIFYESPHRIFSLLEMMREVFGHEREIVVARELTKLFETIHSGTISELLAWMTEDKNQQRGEMVVLVKGSEEMHHENTESENILEILLKELPLKQAVDLTAQITHQGRNEIYQLALDMKKR